MFSAQQTAYYNPLVTPIPAGSAAVDVAWIAFPNRLVQYLGQDQVPSNPYNLTQDMLNQLADTGGLAKYPIPTTRCPQADWSAGGTTEPYGPYGPRGWLDEYCEFSVVRNASNKIVRIDFTCENPEYYQTLWRINPQTLADVYTATLNAGAPQNQWVKVAVADLQLLDPTTAAWLELPNSTDWPRYKISKAVVTYPGQKPKTVVVGLVGLHIIHKTALGQQFVWATFEHKQNVPDVTEVANKTFTPPYTYFSTSCNPSTDYYKCVANANPAQVNDARTPTTRRSRPCARHPAPRVRTTTLSA